MDVVLASIGAALKAKTGAHRHRRGIHFHRVLGYLTPAEFLASVGVDV